MGLPLRLQLQPSRRLCLLQSLVHAAASGGVFISPLPLPLQLFIAGLLAFSLGRSWKDGGRPADLDWIRLGKKGELACGLVDGRTPVARILPGTVWRHLVVLRYRTKSSDGRWSLPRARVILVDSLAGEEEFRQLRVWLGWRARVRDDGFFG